MSIPTAPAPKSWSTSWPLPRPDFGQTRAKRWLLPRGCPSRGGSPLPSSALVADPPRSRAKPRLMPWSIPAYRVLPAEAIPIFQACTGQGMLTNGVGIGVDLAYWSQAVRFGAALVARQQYLPGTIHDANGARAAWMPLFIGADAERLARLSQRMPASARALSGPDAGQPPDQPAATVLRTFVAAVADSLIRNANGAPEVAAPKGRRARASFRQRTRRLVERPEINRRSSSRHSRATGAAAGAGGGMAAAHCPDGQRAVSGLLPA